MYNSNSKQKSSFPDPLALQEEKLSKSYGLRYAKAIETQWGKLNDKSSLYGSRNNVLTEIEDTQTELKTLQFTSNY